jgi:DNA primase
MYLKRLLPQPRQFWEGELGRLSRPDRKNYVKGNCPFHRSKSKTSFSVSLTTGSFHCWGCDAHGSMLDFIMQRDSVDFKTAAKKLGAWTEVTPEERKRFQEQDARLNTEREALAAKERQEREFRHALASDIRDMVETQLELCARLNIEETDSEEAEHCWRLLSELEDLIRDADRLYMQTIGEEFNG